MGIRVREDGSGVTRSLSLYGECPKCGTPGLHKMPRRFLFTKLDKDAVSTARERYRYRRDAYHARGWRSYSYGDVWDSERKWVEDLPTSEEWPDETTEIRSFLNQVREAALSAARSHGKSLSLVEGWLARHELNAPPPPPVEYTFTVRAPAGTTREDIINSARQLGQQGWEIN